VTGKRWAWADRSADAKLRAAASVTSSTAPPIPSGWTSARPPPPCRLRQSRLIAALSLARYGAKVIAVADAFGGILNRNGLNLWDLEKHVARHKTVAGFPEAEPLTNEQLLVLPCDILVPAALERQITEANAAQPPVP